MEVINIKNDRELFSYLMDLSIKYQNVGEFYKILFDINTQEGLPLSTIFDELKSKGVEKEYRIYLLWRVLTLITNHKTMSGITYKRLTNQQEYNKKIMFYYIKNEEVLD